MLTPNTPNEVHSETQRLEELHNAFIREGYDRWIKLCFSRYSLSAADSEDAVGDLFLDLFSGRLAEYPLARERTKKAGKPIRFRHWLLNRIQDKVKKYTRLQQRDARIRETVPPALDESDIMDSYPAVPSDNELLEALRRDYIRVCLDQTTVWWELTSSGGDIPSEDLRAMLELEVTQAEVALKNNVSPKRTSRRVIAARQKFQELLKVELCKRVPEITDIEVEQEISWLLGN